MCVNWIQTIFFEKDITVKKNKVFHKRYQENVFKFSYDQFEVKIPSKKKGTLNKFFNSLQKNKYLKID